MLRDTIQKKYGPLTESQEKDFVTLHRALLDLHRYGISVNAPECYAVVDSPETPVKVKRAVQHLLQRDDKIYPEYDMFRTSGRTFIYSVDTNLPQGVPISIFSEDSELQVPVSLEGDPVDTVTRLGSMIRNGFLLGPVVGQTVLMRWVA